jgi:hypothetical protein
MRFHREIAAFLRFAPLGALVTPCEGDRLTTQTVGIMIGVCCRMVMTRWVVVFEFISLSQALDATSIGSIRRTQFTTCEFVVKPPHMSLDPIVGAFKDTGILPGADLRFLYTGESALVAEHQEMESAVVFALGDHVEYEKRGRFIQQCVQATPAFTRVVLPRKAADLS